MSIVTICLVFAFGMVVQAMMTGVAWQLLMKERSFRQGLIDGIVSKSPEDVTLCCPVCKVVRGLQ